MEAKIFKNSFLVSLLILFLSGIIFSYLIYDHVRDRVYSELRTEAVYAAAGLESGGDLFFDSLKTERRITLVGRDGSVLYDNRGDPAAMENHLNREEIAGAFANGSGQSRHYSGTTMEQTVYYAVLLNDGNVLRVSASYDSVFTLIEALLVPALAAMLIILLICGFISSRLSRQITEPINAIDLNNPSETNLYNELSPLVQRINEQNRTIKAQMDELGRRQREFAAITENMSEGLLLLDEKGALLFANRFAAQLLGGEQDIKHISREHCRKEICEGAEAALAGERKELVFAEGRRTLQLISSPVPSMGHVSGAVLLILDVTERERRDELRREFSANVSHELKTPLTSISGFAELMMRGDIKLELVREFSADIYNESRRMINLVEDIIFLSRLDEEGEQPEMELLELKSLAEDCLAILKSFADKKSVAIELRGSETWIYANRRIMTETVFNLCENGIKYNKPGGKLSVELSSEDETIKLRVKDTGIGIPHEHQSRIFERFYRVDKSHSKASGGTGLGLSIVRNGLKYHGASISLKSAEGQGSDFTVIFPGKGCISNDKL